MTGEKQRCANRLNARKCTGPRTGAGKARSARNALRHGLARPARLDPQLVQAIAELARAIAGAGASPDRHVRAVRVAAAHVEVMRVRQASATCIPGASVATSSSVSSRSLIVTSDARSRAASGRCVNSTPCRQARLVSTTLAKRNQYLLVRQEKPPRVFGRSACLDDQPPRCAQQRAGQQDGSDNGREPADHESEREGNGDRLDTIIALLILIVSGTALRGRRSWCSQRRIS